MWFGSGTENAGLGPAMPWARLPPALQSQVRAGRAIVWPNTSKPTPVEPQQEGSRSEEPQTTLEKADPKR